jgi:hypothetical protein
MILGGRWDAEERETPMGIRFTVIEIDVPDPPPSLYEEWMRTTIVTEDGRVFVGTGILSGKEKFREARLAGAIDSFSNQDGWFVNLDWVIEHDTKPDEVQATIEAKEKALRHATQGGV